MIKKETPFGELEIIDAHVHFFSHNFYELLAKQSPVLSQETDAVGKIGEITGLPMPPENAVDLAKTWVEQLDKNNVSKAMLMASLPNDETSVAEAVKAFPDRFYGAFFFNPLQENAVERAAKAFDEFGLKVICLFPAMHGFSVGDNETVKEIAKLVSKRKSAC